MATKKGGREKTDKLRINLRWISQRPHAYPKRVFLDDDFEKDSRNLTLADVGAISWLWRDRRDFRDALRAYRADNSGSRHETRLRKSAANQILAALGDNEDFIAAEAALDSIVQATTRTFPSDQALERKAMEAIESDERHRERFFALDDQDRRQRLRENAYALLSDEQQETGSVMSELLTIVKPALRAFANPSRFFTTEVYKFDETFPDITLDEGELPMLDVSPFPPPANADRADRLDWLNKVEILHALARAFWGWGAGVLLNPSINKLFHLAAPKFQRRLLALAEMRDSFTKGRPKGSLDAPDTKRKARSKETRNDYRKSALQRAADDLKARPADTVLDELTLKKHASLTRSIRASAMNEIAAKKGVQPSAIRKSLSRHKATRKK